MPKRVKQYGLALVGVGVAVAVIAPAVIAAGDTDDFIQPGRTVVQTSLKTGTRMQFIASVAGVTIIISCIASSTSGTTPAHGLVIAVRPMSFTGCTDNLWSTDTIKTSGIWHVTFLDAANDEAAEAPGDRLVVTIPIMGMTVFSTAAPGCVVTVAPTAPAHLVGAYNDVNTLALSSAPAPAALSAGCPGGAKNTTAKFSGTYVLTPGVHDAS
jgi:hypothetical protein